MCQISETHYSLSYPNKLHSCDPVRLKASNYIVCLCRWFFTANVSFYVSNKLSMDKLLKHIEKHHPLIEMTI